MSNEAAGAAAQPRDLKARWRRSLIRPTARDFLRRLRSDRRIVGAASEGLHQPVPPGRHERLRVHAGSEWPSAVFVARRAARRRLSLIFVAANPGI